MNSHKQFKKMNDHEDSIEDLYHGVTSGNRTLLARAITLIESNARKHQVIAQTLLQQLLPHTGNSLRIGISGVPGAGKSTFIEAFGSYLCNEGWKVAVLAVDPSSSVSGGSILGDKTRMEKLSQHPSAFIRPSPSSGKLGGVHRKTKETILLCEAAGFDIILIETVGVGQSEILVRDMVDFFMLFVLTGAGDELQGMKKGIMEIADAIFINKADGENKEQAEVTRREFNRVLHFLQPATIGWSTKAYTCSALHREGIEEVWNIVEKFRMVTMQSQIFQQRRRMQTIKWMRAMIVDELEQRFFHHPVVQEWLPKYENEVLAEERTVTNAVQELLLQYFQFPPSK